METLHQVIAILVYLGLETVNFEKSVRSVWDMTNGITDEVSNQILFNSVIEQVRRKANRRVESQRFESKPEDFER